MWKKRKFQYAVLGLILLAALYAVLRPRAVAIEAAAAARGPLTVTVDEEGRTRVRERFVVAAPVGGRLQRIDLHEGDEVAVGTIVAHIAPAPLDPRAQGQAEARLRASEASREAASSREQSARAAFDQAHRDRERSDEMGREGIQPVEGHERAVLSEVAAAADLAAARHATEAAIQEVAEARAALLATSPEARRASSLVPVRSPQKATILRVLQESDRVVAAGTPLFELGDLDDLEVVAELLSSDAVNVKPGAAMWIGGWGGSHDIAGKVRRVEPSGFTKVSALGVEEQRVNVVGDFVSGSEGLGDGFRVEVRVVVWESQSALKIPGSALYRTGSDWRAFVIESGRAVSRIVQVGHRTPTEAEILGGVVEGDRVILYPGDRVGDGTRVE
jgi:HlyD family secretion protein